MRILIVKLTSMGDVLHLLPALSDIQQNMPNAKIDWLVEDSFVDIAAWHPIVNKVIPVGSRRWRRQPWRHLKDIKQFWISLRQQRYDLIIDAQGLMKSAIITRLAHLTHQGQRAGFDKHSIKEGYAAMCYDKQVRVPRNLHAIERLRQLCAQTLDYQYSETQLDYGIESLKINANKQTNQRAKILFLHGTTWPTKHLKDQHWRELATLAIDNGYEVILPWGNDTEYKRAKWIANNNEYATVLPKMSLNDLSSQIQQTQAAIAVDTGLGHMAAAFGLPTVSIYLVTDPNLIGTQGENQTHIQFDGQDNVRTEDIWKQDCLSNL